MLPDRGMERFGFPELVVFSREFLGDFEVFLRRI